ncbi:glycosyltransferase family 4 protein [Candidatus Micrarchaeota archaeon]|nr:glycosyltransferase family 4 protein [Candidatus Micrarchaeota archaeon]
MPLKILLVNALFHPFKGGVENHMLELGKRLCKRGVEVHVLTGRIRGTKPYEVVGGIRVHRVACAEIRLPGYYPPPLVIAPTALSGLRALDAREDFDIIHLQNAWFPDFNSAGVYAKAMGKPFVFTVHNARPLGIAPHITVVGGIYDAIMSRQVLKLADRIISVSEWAAHDVAKHGVPLSRFTIIPNGIDAGKIRPVGTNAFRKRHGIRDDAPLLVFIGRVIEQKGLNYLLQAMPAILKRHPSARLAIVGTGSEKGMLEKLAGRLGVSHAVIFTGFVTEEEKLEALHACDIFVLPSLWEVLPVAILEAMAAGKPIVCTDAGGNPELVKTGVNGTIVPKRKPQALSSAVNGLIGDGNRLKRMGIESRRIAVEKFDWRIIADRTMQFYGQLLAGRKKPGHDGGLANRYAVQIERMTQQMGKLMREGESAPLRKKVKLALERYGRKWKEMAGQGD